MNDLKAKISEIIFNELSYIYCDNCRMNKHEEMSTEEIKDNACQWYHRKDMGWELSKKESDKIADKIITLI